MRRRTLPKIEDMPTELAPWQKEFWDRVMKNPHQRLIIRPRMPGKATLLRMLQAEIERRKGNSLNWSSETPTGNGFYWFYGLIFDQQTEPEMEFVHLSAGLVYLIGDDRSRDPVSMKGKWLRVEMPEEPE